MPTKPAKKKAAKPTLKERAKTTLRKIVPAPKKPSGRGSPPLGSGIAERGKSAVIKGRSRTADALKEMGE